MFLAAEQIEPLTRDQPEPGVTGDRDATRQIDRVVAAELGAVNVGMGDKGSAVALVAEAPDHAGFGRLELRQADHGAGIGKIRHGIVPLDGQTAETVHHHALGGRRPGREPAAGQFTTADRPEACQHGDKGYSGARANSGPPAVSFLPLCRHS